MWEIDDVLWQPSAPWKLKIIKLSEDEIEFCMEHELEREMTKTKVYF